MQTTLDTPAISRNFTAILDSLSEKESIVISRRMGLHGNKSTLQAIGDEFQITRERVRQIEETAIRKIGRVTRSNNLFAIQEIANNILAKAGGIMIRDDLVSMVAKEIATKDTSLLAIIEVLIQSDFNIEKSKPQLGARMYFALPNVHKKHVDAVHKEAVKILKKRGNIIEQDKLYEILKMNLFATFGKLETSFINRVMDVFLDIVKGEEIFIWLASWKILNPSTLKDKALYIFKKQKEPMHFVALTNAIAEQFHESVKTATIHNELIRNEEFVLIGRGIYVLKEWGYEDGTVLDVVRKVLKKAGGPLSTDEIISGVLETRKVKASTVYMNLQNKKVIERVGRNLYQLKGEAV